MWSAMGADWDRHVLVQTVYFVMYHLHETAPFRLDEVHNSSLWWHKSKEHRLWYMGLQWCDFDHSRHTSVWFLCEKWPLSHFAKPPERTESRRRIKQKLHKKKHWATSNLWAMNWRYAPKRLYRWEVQIQAKWMTYEPQNEQKE